MLARQIHAWSNRPHRPFTELNCATVQGDLAESELFGHERGAFTGAQQRKPGLFEASEGGTLFLDEIAEMEVRTQAKLLHALENKCFRRVGGVASSPMNVRVIAATNRDLRHQVRLRQFREDLFHRLNIFTIQLPPLRSCKEDIVALAAYFIAGFSRNAVTLSPPVLDMFQRYHWPGNIRELRNVLERAFILCSGATSVLPSHLGALTGLVENESCKPNFGTLREAECLEIQHAVNSHLGNISAAAKTLGISRATIYRKAKRYGIHL